MKIVLVIDNLAYRLGPKGLETATAVGYDAVNYPEGDLIDFGNWMLVPPVAVRTPRQMAMLAHIKAALETAETSQM